ncbi:MAG: PAT family beta-lactamase induction signal transducer AmpG [Bradymonadia bacterium]|jgi:PAT family beta-lactamase induction signal transducer AmpG
MTMTSRFGLLAALYFSQGLPYGFFTKGLGALLRESGVSLQNIGLASLLFLPWALKFLWAPLIDRFGRRKSWILPLQTTAAIALLVLAQLDLAANLPLVIGLIVGINLVSATQDIATDGLAVSLLGPQERGMGNAIQVGAYRIGMIVGSGAILVAYAEWGWRASVSLMAVLIVCASVPIALYREPPRPVLPKQGAMAVLRIGVDFARRPGALGWFAVLICMKAFDALSGPMIAPMMVDQGYSIGEIGVIAGTAGSIAGLVGAVVGGLGARSLGRVRALIVFGLAQVFAVGLYVLPAMQIGGEASMYLAIVMDNLLGSAATVALFTAMMDVCRPATEATDYTIQACVIVILAGMSSAFSGYLVVELGYRDHFVLTAGLTFVGWLLMVVLLRAGVLDRLRVDPASDIEGVLS